MPTDEDNLETSATDWVIDHPQTTPLFDRHGVDYSCAGKSLRYACRQAGVEPEAFLAELLVMIRADHHGADGGSSANGEHGAP